MAKMAGSEFDVWMSEFLKILERQPNLIAPRHSGTALGESLADTAVAFIDRLHELRSQRVDDSEG